MTGRRVVLGRYNDGSTIGLRVSLPGVDALTGDSSVPGFSFDSEWTDIVETAYIGLVGYTGYSFDIGFGGGVIAFNGYHVPHGLGYKAFMEARLIQSGVTIRDDYVGLTAGTVGAPFVQHSSAPGNAYFNTGVNIGAFLVIVYKISVPSG